VVGIATGIRVVGAEVGGCGLGGDEAGFALGWAVGRTLLARDNVTGEI